VAGRKRRREEGGGGETKVLVHKSFSVAGREPPGGLPYYSHRADPDGAVYL